MATLVHSFKVVGKCFFCLLHIWWLSYIFTLRSRNDLCSCAQNIVVFGTIQGVVGTAGQSAFLTEDCK